MAFVREIFLTDEYTEKRNESTIEKKQQKSRIVLIDEKLKKFNGSNYPFLNVGRGNHGLVGPKSITARDMWLNLLLSNQIKGTVIPVPRIDRSVPCVILIGPSLI